MAKILIVEDEPLLLQAYARILESASHEVSGAATAEEGLRLCASERPDLVLLDSLLPDGDGLDVCKRVKADPDLSRSSVILISGRRISADEQAEGLESGADGYLTKPIERRTLLAHVRALLRITETERALRESEERQRQLVDDLRLANRRLEEYNRLKAEFVANMSHELRTPLTAIIGFVQLVEMSEGDKIPKPYATAFERILRNGRHLLALIDDVLDVAKIEAGRMKIHREPFDLVEVVRNAFRELQSLARQKGIDYRLNVPEPLPFAFSDPLRVRQVVINLLSNAIKFTPHGAVEAELVAWDEGRCRFVVRDTGVGIDEDAMGFIFERFRQVDGSMSRVAGGAGLGLSIVRQIAELLGGTIEVASRVGEGSTFTVTLPLVAPDPDLMPMESALAEAAASGALLERSDGESSNGDGRGKLLVLIVEDDPDASALLSQTVTSAGYRYRVAPSGSVGLELARQLQPAAITLDVMMPGMDGWRVLQALKADPRTQEIPVIVCSIVDNRALGYRLGASAYLLKPVDPEQLTLSLRSVSGSELPEGDGYVLVVDDEHGVRELLATALRKAGYRVRPAASGEAALAAIAQAVPQAVISDLIMPQGMSGFELIARLRHDPRTEHTPVLIVTGKDLTPEDRRLIVDQIADVIRKGDLLMSDLQTRLRETLEGLGVTPSDGENSAD
ncbi:MAG TPA: response regulator [Thermoanaerobaculia bacterium]|nr:response regulator [Thermoanaerobaculia bacterium]